MNDPIPVIALAAFQNFLSPQLFFLHRTFVQIFKELYGRFINNVNERYNGNQ
jgi:hypothetical protein